MKKSLLAIYLFGILLFPMHVSALSPPLCVIENNCSEKELCRWNNVNNNWPKDTGNRTDCSELSDKRPSDFNYITAGIAGLAIIFTLLGIALIVQKRKKSL